jgi:stearoyl-CoA desaturase (delta-9 desaturase)
MSTIPFQNAIVQRNQIFAWLLEYPSIFYFGAAACHLIPLFAAYMAFHRIHWRFIVLTGYFFGCCASIAHHRYFTHKSFQTSRSFQFLLDILGTFGFDSSGIQMCSWHTIHHRLEDKDGDPHYNPDTSRIYKYIGHYLVRKEFKTIVFDNVQQWSAFPELFILCLIQPYLSYILYGTFVCTVYSVRAFSSDWICYTFIPIIIAWHFQLIDGYPGHINKPMHGHKTTYSEARDCWWIALLNCGGGWHGSHHQFKNCAWHGHKWYHLDIVFLLIKLLECVGLVWDVVVVENKMKIIDRIGRVCVAK